MYVAISGMSFNSVSVGSEGSGHSCHRPEEGRDAKRGSLLREEDSSARQRGSDRGRFRENGAKLSPMFLPCPQSHSHAVWFSVFFNIEMLEMGLGIRLSHFFIMLCNRDHITCTLYCHVFPYMSCSPSRPSSQSCFE